MELVLIPGFISEAERSHLSDKARAYLEAGVLDANPLGPNRFFKKIYGTQYVDSVVESVAEKVVGVLGLEGYAVDPHLGWIISVIMPGGFVQPHRDDFDLYVLSDNRHLRCNVMVSRGHPSADPIIDCEQHAVEERGLWAFFASEVDHATRPLAGVEPRIVYQFGFTVPGHYRLPGRGASSVPAPDAAPRAG